MIDLILVLIGEKRMLWRLQMSNVGFIYGWLLYISDFNEINVTDFQENFSGDLLSLETDPDLYMLLLNEPSFYRYLYQIYATPNR